VRHGPSPCTDNVLTFGIVTFIVHLKTGTVQEQTVPDQPVYCKWTNGVDLGAFFIETQPSLRALAHLSLPLKVSCHAPVIIIVIRHSMLLADC
jgi:hypothetical protein